MTALAHKQLASSRLSTIYAIYEVVRCAQIEPGKERKKRQKNMPEVRRGWLVDQDLGAQR
jgi:hypothetical protein